MKVWTRILGGISILFLLTQCTVPPTGTEVFDEDSDPEEIVNEYHGITEEELEGYDVIEIETQSIGNPADTNLTYVPARHQPAEFD